MKFRVSFTTNEGATARLVWSCTDEMDAHRRARKVLEEFDGYFTEVFVTGEELHRFCFRIWY